MSALHVCCVDPDAESFWRCFEAGQREEAANLIAERVPRARWGMNVTGYVECPHCEFQLHGFQEVGRDPEGTNHWTAYECLRCGATHLLGDHFDALGG